MRNNLEITDLKILYSFIDDEIKRAEKKNDTSDLKTLIIELEKLI